MLHCNGARRNVSVPLRAASSTVLAAEEKRKILHGWDPMTGPSSIAPKPDLSAMGVKLVPVESENGAAAPGN